jgi:glycosyltransferase involved in cell wall biosynthesis
MGKLEIIFDNIIYFLQHSGGGSVYWTEIIKRALNDNDLIVKFSEPKGIPDNICRKQLPIKVNIVEKEPLSLLRISAFSGKINKKTLFHSSYYRISHSKYAINIVTIHDFTSEFYLTGPRKFVHKYRKRKAIFNADYIICISKNTKKDLIKLYPKISKNKIKVIYNGVSKEFYNVSEKLKITDIKFSKLLNTKCILYIGHRTSYKNFTIAVQTIAKLKNDYYFVIIGEKLSSDETKFLEKYIPHRYNCFTKLNNKDLNILYNIAFCLIYPSSYEGFGIPILEAMKAGCPVVATNKSSIPEVAGDAALLVDDISADAFAEIIKKLENSSTRQGLIEKGYLQAAKFSWDKCYKEIKDIYIECFNNIQR